MRIAEQLSTAAPIEEHHVGAVLALDDVAAVARVPLEDIVVGAQEGDVVALLSVDEAVAVATEQLVDAVGFQDDIGTGTAVDGDLDQRREVAGGGEGSRRRRWR